MARPITWQNINGPDPKAAMLPMSVAAQTINDAFSSLKDTWEGHQTGIKDRNTEAFMNALSQYRTPEELEAARQSGALDSLYQSFNGMINPEAREAGDQLLTRLLTNTKAMNEHTDLTRSRSERELVNDLQTLMAQDPEAALKLIAESGLSNRGELATAAREAIMAKREAARKESESIDRSQLLSAQTEGAYLSNDAQDIANNAARGQVSQTARERELDGIIAPALDAHRNALMDGQWNLEQQAQSQEAIRRSLIQSGEYSIGEVDAAMARNDAVLPFRQAQQADLQEQYQNHPLHGSSNTPTDIYKNVVTGLKDMGVDPNTVISRTSVEDMLKAMGEMMTEKITVTDPKTKETVEVPIPDHAHFIASLRSRGHAPTYKTELRKLINSPEFIRDLGEYLLLQNSTLGSRLSGALYGDKK